MPIQVNLHKQNYVATQTKINNRPVTIKASQAHSYNARRRIVTDVMTPAPDSTSLQSGSNRMIQYIIKNNVANTIKNLTLRFQVRSDVGSSPLAPTAMWFQRIEFINRSTGEEIGRLQGDILFMYQNAVRTEHTASWSELININPVNYKHVVSAHAVGTTRYYYLPLVGSVFDNMDLDMSHTAHEIEIRMIPVSTGITIHGVSSTLALIEVAGIFDVELNDYASETVKRSLLQRSIVAHQYLDSQEFRLTAQTLASSTSYEYDLDQFKHTSAGLMLAIRKTGYNNAFGSSISYSSLGDGTIDVIGTGGTSIFGGGRAVHAKYLKNVIAPRFVESEYFLHSNMYPVLFGNLNKAMRGSMDGVHAFDGEKNKLRISTPATGSNAFVTITQSAAMTAGNYQLSYKGEYTRPIVFNESVISMEIALQTLFKHKAIDIVGTFAGTSIVITISELNGQPFNLTSPINAHYFNGSTPNVAATSVLTPWVEGWDPTGTYEVIIYSLYFKGIYQNNNTLMTRDL